MNKAGFTLIELSIVLAVLGILTVIGVSMARPLKQVWEVHRMRLNAELALHTVEEFIVTHKRLPSEKEFGKFNLPTGGGKCVYHINPALDAFSVPEQYCEHRYENAAAYAYTMDFETSGGVSVFRRLKSYDDLLADLRCKRGLFPEIVTKALPPVRTGSSYNAGIVFQSNDAGICIAILNEDERERSAIKRFFGDSPYFSAAGAPVCSVPADKRVNSGGIFHLSSGDRVFTDNMTLIKLRIAVSSPLSDDNTTTVRDYVIPVTN